MELKKAIIKGIQSEVYYVNKLGDIFSKQSDGSFLKMKTYLTEDGYNRISLKRFDKKHHRMCRIIAETFLPNLDNLPMVNHKNEIRNDDRVENLEWCDHSYNMKYHYRNGDRYGTKAKKVYQIELNTGKVINEFPTPRKAFLELGIQAQNIAKVCRGERISAGGYGWKYAE